MKKILVSGLLYVCASAAAAQSIGDHNGAAQIARGDYAAAERVLTRSLRVDVNDAELLINMATVYARTGRAEAARKLYAQVLAVPDERLALDTGGVSRAHALAKAGLDRLGGVTLASR